MCKILRILILLVIFISGACSIVQSQSFTIQTVLDTNRIEIGDKVLLKYIVESNDENYISFPQYADTIVTGVEILESLVDSTILEDNKLRLEKKLLLTSFDMGMYYIPPQAFTFTDVTYTDTVYSKPTYLQVIGVEIDTTGAIRDIAGLDKAPIIWNDFIPLYAIVLIGGLVYLILFFIRKRKGESAPELVPQKPREPAHIIALRELDRLNAQKLWQQNQLKEYYTRLTYIIRAYIENQFGVQALEETTQEILKDIESVGLHKKINMTQLKQLLTLADLIKFAKGDAQPEENIEQLEVAYDFVKSSKDETINGVEGSTNSDLDKRGVSKAQV